MQNRHYPRKLRSQLRHWQNKVDRLRSRMNDAGEETRRELENQIEDLRAKQKAAREKLAQVDQSGNGRRGMTRFRLRRLCGRLRSMRRRWFSVGR